jgi:dipeptidase
MCDTLCVRTGTGTLFAKNSDRHPSEVQVVESHARRAPGASLATQYLTLDDPGAFAFVGSRPTWLWGVEHGVNEHGVAIGNEKIWTVDKPRSEPPALIGMDLVRLTLERAATADDALDVLTALLEQHGQAGSGEPHADEPYYSSFLLADAHQGWVVETSDRTWAARPAGNGCAISNRISLTTDWTRASADVTSGTSFDDWRLPAMPTGVADHRLAITTEAAQNATTPRELASVLRSHNAHAVPPAEIGSEWEGFTVCMHRPELHAQTTASMIAALTPDVPPRIWACLGNPCVGVYVPAFPPAVPKELADEQQWHRFARLRDRVEAAPSALAEIRAVLDPVEAELWAVADDVAATGRGAEDWAAGAYAPVSDALLRLGA